MCTVTLLPMGDHLRVMANRDERHDRPVAHPPLISRAGGALALMPVDPQGGGTWIAATSAGLVFALLNGTGDVPATAPSRGRLILELLDCMDLRQVQARAQSLTWRGWPPHRLLGLRRPQDARTPRPSRRSQRRHLRDARAGGFHVGRRLVTWRPNRPGASCSTSWSLARRIRLMVRTRSTAIAGPIVRTSACTCVVTTTRRRASPPSTCRRRGCGCATSRRARWSASRRGCRSSAAPPHAAARVRVGAWRPDRVVAMALWILLATFVSEDAAALWAGWLVRTGELTPAVALGACGLGIYLGDAGLWLAGRALARSERCHRWCVRRLPRVLGRALALAVDEPAALVASRFLPGTRLPLYLAAGALGTQPARFFGWTAVAVALWTPLVVLGTSELLVGGVLVVALVRGAQTARGQRIWRRVAARVGRWTRPEFWPACAGLCAARRRGSCGWRRVTAASARLGAANPGFEDGGFVGESKFAILRRCRRAWTVPRRRSCRPAIRVRAAARVRRRDARGRVDVPARFSSRTSGRRAWACAASTSRDEARGVPGRRTGAGDRAAAIIRGRSRPASSTTGVPTRRAGASSASPTSASRCWSATACPRWRSCCGRTRATGCRCRCSSQRHDGARVLADGERAGRW